MGVLFGKGREACLAAPGSARGILRKYCVSFFPEDLNPARVLALFGRKQPLMLRRFFCHGCCTSRRVCRNRDLYPPADLTPHKNPASHLLIL